jgi:hypothetical protein
MVLLALIAVLKKLDILAPVKSGNARIKRAVSNFQLRLAL